MKFPIIRSLLCFLLLGPLLPSSVAEGEKSLTEIRKEMPALQDATVNSVSNWIAIAPGPINVEFIVKDFLTVTKVRWPGKVFSEGLMSVQEILDNLPRFGATYQMTEDHINVILKCDSDMPNILDGKLPQAIDRNMTFKEWLSWIQGPGLNLPVVMTAPWAKDAQMIHIDLPAGASIRDLLNLVALRSGQRWTALTYDLASVDPEKARLFNNKIGGKAVGGGVGLVPIWRGSSQ